MKRLAILGSTGVLGSKALEVVKDYREEFKVVSLVAGHRSEKFKAQVGEFKPGFSGVGTEALVKAVTGADLVIVAVVGKAGIAPTLAALKAGKTVGLATKEVMVLKGKEVMELAEKSRGLIIPVDSEHCAIFQSLKAGKAEEIKNLYLTMGKGRISTMSEAEKQRLTPKQVLQRKTWAMGQKISIDSATCLNKAFEIIEARWLFNVKPEQIKVVVHPEYVCHSLVEFTDGSWITELGVPEMKRYLAYAMFYPERKIVPKVPELDLSEKSLSFERVDLKDYPGLRLGYSALEKGGKASEVLYEADERAVDRFLEGKIKFTQIVPEIEAEMEKI
ncbi:MAG: 1-deoxy-D-xylulose-5-phosphate reductoisomerase [Candidatus Beckwithbacteria bacterium]